MGSVGAVVSPRAHAHARSRDARRVDGDTTRASERRVERERACERTRERASERRARGVDRHLVSGAWHPGRDARASE